MLVLDENALRPMVLGGAVLGGGGGGTIRGGLEAGRRALARGRPILVDLSEIEGDDPLVTLSRVGSTTGVRGVGPMHVQELKALCQFVRSGERRIAGFLPSEVGPLAVTYGWYLSALTGVPVVDCPCNGRAHPLGIMGSLGLDRFPRHVTLTAAAGGPGRGGREVELLLRANAEQASSIVRAAVEKAGVPVAVVRNPLPASFVERHAAPGALTDARRVGEVMLAQLRKGIAAILVALADAMQGKVLAAEGFVKSVAIEEKSGFSIGHVAVRAENGTQIMIPVCNEFMAAFDGETPLALFPDLVSLLDHETGLPLASAEVRQSARVAVFCVPRQHLKLSSTMQNAALLEPVERLLKISLTGRQPALETAVYDH